MVSPTDPVADSASAIGAKGERPLVSIVLPVYNGARYLGAAIESVLRQTYSNFELLVIDDGSSDSSVALAAAYARLDSRVVIFRNEVNLGLVSTLNRAFSLAKGDLIARLDADDIADAQRLQLQVSRFLEDPDIVALGTGIRLMDEDGTTLRRQPRVVCGNVLLRWCMLRGTCLYHPTLMLHVRRLGSPVRYSAQFAHSEDYELLLRLSRLCVIDNLPSVLVSQRVHRQSVSAIFRDEQLSSAASALKIHVKEIYEIDLSPQQAKSLIYPRGLLESSWSCRDSPIATLLLLERRFLAAEVCLSRRDKEAIASDVALFAWKLLTIALTKWRGGARPSLRLGLLADCMVLLARRPISTLSALFR